MKVIHLGNVALPPHHPDFGRNQIHPGRWVLNHALSQKAHTNLDVEVVSIAHKSSCDFVTEVEGVKVHFLRTYHVYRAATGFALDRIRMAHYVRKLRPDVIHAHGTEDAYALTAQDLKLPYVVSIQALLFQILPRLEHPNFIMRCIRFWERRALAKAKVVIAKVEYTRKFLQPYYPRLDMRLIPNTYQPELDAPLIPKRPNTLCFVGTLDERKGLHIIADAMPTIKAEIPDVELRIVGNPPHLVGYSAEQVAKLQSVLGDRLQLLGKMPTQQVFQNIAPCVAILAPSLEETFGNALVEGLMQGCHGIVADETGFVEHIRRFGNGTLIPQRDSHALAEAAIRALRNPPSAHEQEATRQAIRDYMSPRSVARKHEALYTELMRKPFT